MLGFVAPRIGLRDQRIRLSLDGATHIVSGLTLFECKQNDVTEIAVLARYSFALEQRAAALVAVARRPKDGALWAHRALKTKGLT